MFKFDINESVSLFLSEDTVARMERAAARFGDAMDELNARPLAPADDPRYWDDREYWEMDFYHLLDTYGGRCWRFLHHYAAKG